MAIDLSRFNDHKEAYLDVSDEDKQTCRIVLYSTVVLFAGWDLSRERAKYLIIPAAPRSKKAKAILIHQVPDNFVDWDSGQYGVATPDGQMIVEGVFEGGTLALTWNGLKGVDPNLGDCWVPIEIERGVGIAVTLPAWLFAKKAGTAPTRKRMAAAANSPRSRGSDAPKKEAKLHPFDRKDFFMTFEPERKEPAGETR